MPRKSCSGTRVTVLALSTSSPALSIALFDGRKVLARHHQLIGRGHAEALVPAIAALLTGRRAEAIIVDIGPGSYTGIRIGIAAARALGRRDPFRVGAVAQLLRTGPRLARGA